MPKMLVVDDEPEIDLLVARIFETVPCWGCTCTPIRANISRAMDFA